VPVLSLYPIYWYCQPGETKSAAIITIPAFFYVWIKSPKTANQHPPSFLEDRLICFFGAGGGGALAADVPVKWA
jgi:hypothetical protein